jgi:predicted ATPase/DNA-binding CsgD family transcriptional regulator/transcriptional regulator with XRE-family HTH domain
MAPFKEGLFPMNFEETIPNERLRRARFQMGLTQAELAEKVGTTFETVSRWERGIKAPSAYYRRKLCDVFGKTAEELGLLVDSGPFFASDSSACIFLSSAYSDAELKFVVSLKEDLQTRGITVWSSRTIRRQETRNKRNVLQEAIRAAQVVLLIVSPRTLTSHHVHDTLRLARYFKRPVYAVWINGKNLQECIPLDYGDPFVIIDAREEDERILRDKIVATLEQAWLAPSEPDISALSELEWKLPAKLKPLVGREEELSRLSELLHSPQVRLVTLLGPGGIGKTHLATTLALEMRERFVDGVCVVSLAAISDPRLVVSAIAKELGITEVGESSLFEQLKVSLVNRRLLLLLDNFEQVVEASSQLSELLAECPRIKILVTSRARLHIDEYEFSVPPLALPDVTSPMELDFLLHNAAVALFLQRAQAAKPDFRINTTNAHIIAEICVRLDGLPLAIELAAARIRSLASQALLTRLEEHPLDVVMSRDQEISDRQRTLRNTIAWSYNLLDMQEQQLFRRLCVFVASFSVETVEELYSALGEKALSVWDGVESLLDKSLLRSAEQVGEGRLQLLETIREYGLECLEASGEAEIVRQAHAEYYLRLVEEAEPQLKGVQQIMWLARLEQEFENLRASLKWFIERGEAEFALRLCGALWWFWRLRGYWSEGRRWLEAALELPQTGGPTIARARALLAAGDLAYYQDGNLVARSLLEESVSLCRTLGAEKDLATALSTLGVLLRMQGDRVAADPLLEESEKLCRLLGSSWELSYLLRKLAEHAAQAGELKQAALYAQESFILAKKLGDKSLIATVLSTLGNIAARQDDLTQAKAYNHECLILARELSDKLLIALALNNLGFFTAIQGDLGLTTYAQAQEALTLMRELGDKMYITRTLQTVGLVTAHQENPVQAKTWYREALSVALEIQSEIEMGLSLCGLATIAVAERQLLQAAHLFGAVEARIDLKVDMYPAERAEYERARESVRKQLGGKAFAVARSEGRTMSLEQVLATSWSPAVVSPPPSPRYPDGLTEREVEVLCLVSRGYTDEQIARQLVIAPRTVNSHLTIIYRKIGVSSDGRERQIAPRIAATRYVIEHDLC